MEPHVDLTLYERLVLFLRKIHQRLKKIHKFGLTKVGILLIPHNHEKIAKLEVTVYLAAFILFLSFSLFLLSIQYGIFLLMNSDTDQIFALGQKQKVTFLYYHKISKMYKEQLQEFSSKLEELNRVTWGTKDIQKDTEEQKNFSEISIASFFPSQFPAQDELKSNMNLYKDTTDAYFKINHMLEKLDTSFSKAINYLEMRESILQSMPRGRPLGRGVGFVSSTFGKREDPVYGGGEFHNGVDFAAPKGSPIYAVANGIVAEASYSDNSLGYYVRLNHENGYYTIYAHCNEIKVKKGDLVKRGDIIATVGSTGKSTGNHLHYEVHIGLDPPYNPQEYINLD